MLPILRRFSIFNDLTDEELLKLEPHFEIVKNKKGEYLFREGDPGNSLYLLYEGSVVAEKILDGELGLPPVARTLGARILEVRPEKGTIRMAYEGVPAFTNPMGQIQGGIIASMLDDTMALALLAILDEDEFAPTLELKVNFISPARIGMLEGSGQVVSKGSSVCVVAGELRQDERLVAKSMATALIRPDVRAT